MNEYDAKSRKILAEAKEGETNILFVVVALIAAALLIIAMLTLPRAEAEAAKRPVFKGTVTIVVSNTTKSDPYGQYLNVSLWDLPAAAKAAGIGKYRIVKTRYANEAFGDVYVRSVAKQSKPSSIYKYGEAGVMWESQVTMSDSWGKTHTAAQRKAELVKALKAATPR